MPVWVTRAAPGAEATAARLRERGFEPLVAPLLAVQPLEDAPLDAAGAAALAFTSRNGVAAFAARERRRTWPVFAVGDATAEAARAAGFQDVESAGGDVQALAALIAARRPPGPVLHATSEEPAGDLAGALAAAGAPLVTAILYRTLFLPPSEEARCAWPALSAVLIHSPKAARALASAGLPAGAARVLCISEAAAAPLREAFEDVAAAPSPNEAALLDLLGRRAALGAGAPAR